MANYNANIRTIYFRVTNGALLSKIIGSCDAEDKIHIFESDSSDGSTLFTFGCNGLIRDYISILKIVRMQKHLNIMGNRLETFFNNNIISCNIEISSHSWQGQAYIAYPCPFHFKRKQLWNTK